MKRKAESLFRYFIESFMKRWMKSGWTENTKILNEILLAGSRGSEGKTLSNGLMSSIVIHHQTGGLPLETLNQIAKMPNVREYYFAQVIIKTPKNENGVGYMSQILQETVVDLVKNCMYTRNCLVESPIIILRRDAKFPQIDDSKSKIETFWTLNTSLPKKDQIAYYSVN